MRIPADINGLIEANAARIGLPALREAAARVSERYRAREGGLQIRDEVEALAYAASRMPATYAAAARAFEIVTDVMPDFAPRTMVDMGAGTGAVTLAAAARWPVEAMTLVEPNAAMRAAGQLLFKDAAWVAGGIETDLGVRAFDLVTAGYVLNELPSGQLADRVRGLWRAAAGALVIIEPGTPQGSEVMQQARDVLVSEGAFLAAPCPQSGVCPLRSATERWCHFSVRVERSRLHMQLKDGSLPFEDEKFSFIAASRTEVARPAYRIIGHPEGSKLLRFQTCDDAGQAETVLVPKSDPRHKAARKLAWGDGFN